MAGKHESPGALTDPQTPVPIEVPDTALEPGQVLGNRYEVLGRLGAGGMGFVFHVHDRKMSEDIALKVVASARMHDAAMLDRLRREAKLARKISDRHVCKVFDYVEESGLHFLTMEFIEGRNLRAYMREEDLSPERVVEIIGHVATGLSAVHRENMVHRDVKPENVVLRKNGEAVLVDFGLARRITSDQQTEIVAGTPAYMSPEQLRGEPNVDGRSDVFALGIVAYELLTRKSPFAQTTSAATKSAILRDPPRPFQSPVFPAEVTTRIEKVLLRALAKSADERFASAPEFAEALRCAIAGFSTDSTPRANERAAAKPTQRIGNLRKTGQLLLAIAACVIAIFAGTMVWLRKPARSTTLPVIAIAPFENLTQDSSRQRLLLEALEATRKELQHVSRVRIAHADTMAQARDLVREEGMGWVLVGALEPESRGSRLSAHFERPQDALRPSVAVEVKTDTSDWSRESLADFSTRVVHEARLLQRDHERGARAAVGTENAVAREKLVQFYQHDYQAIVKGGTDEEIRRAEALLDEIIRLDKRYSEAFVERAYLHARIGTPERFALARKDADQAAEIQPVRPAALVMRCRILQVALLVKKNPDDVLTDEGIAEATRACDEALKVAPSSADVHLVFARLHNVQCNDIEARKSLERAREEDFGLTGRTLEQRVFLALDAGDWQRANVASLELFRFEEEQRRLGETSVTARAGVPSVVAAPFLRAVALSKLGQAAEAREMLETQLAWLARNPDVLLEVAALRGLDDPKYEALRKDHEAALVRDIQKTPSLVIDAAGYYKWFDPVKSVEWLELAQKASGSAGEQSCDAWLRIADAYRLAKRDTEARAAVEKCSAKFAWERQCKAWYEDRLPK